MEDDLARRFPLSHTETLHHDILKELNHPLHHLYPYCNEEEYIPYVGFTLLSLLWGKESTVITAVSPGLPYGMEEAPDLALAGFLQEQRKMTQQTYTMLETIILIHGPETVTAALLKLPHWGVMQYIACNWSLVEQQYGAHPDGYTIITTNTGYALRHTASPPFPTCDI